MICTTHIHKYVLLYTVQPSMVYNEAGGWLRNHAHQCHFCLRVKTAFILHKSWTNPASEFDFIDYVNPDMFME